jgi:hypothetical protein
MDEQTVATVKVFSILSLLGHLMDVAHSFVKLSGEQEAAWETVRALVGGLGQ